MRTHIKCAALPVDIEQVDVIKGEHDSKSLARTNLVLAGKAKDGRFFGTVHTQRCNQFRAGVFDVDNGAFDLHSIDALQRTSLWSETNATHAWLGMGVANLSALHPLSAVAPVFARGRGGAGGAGGAGGRGGGGPGGEF